MNHQNSIRWFGELNIEDVPLGVRNASLGEMFSILNDEGIHVPDGFATTASAYWAFIEANNLSDEMNESNPFIGFRGASRYVSPPYREEFALGNAWRSSKCGRRSAWITTSS